MSTEELEGAGNFEMNAALDVRSSDDIPSVPVAASRRTFISTWSACTIDECSSQCVHLVSFP